MALKSEQELFEHILPLHIITYGRKSKKYIAEIIAGS